ncbi:MAG: hypothetical protein RL469_240 [Pseudomonadota bacterium]
MTPGVTLLDPVLRAAVQALLAPWGLTLAVAGAASEIPGSYWGDSEAGLVGSTLWVRDDTPLHSALHEAAHYVCMDAPRRATLLRDAGGDHAEENAVCCLQILWAAALPGIGAERLMADMDAWGYTFRLGSARAWFKHESDDARAWLRARGVIDAGDRLLTP